MPASPRFDVPQDDARAVEEVIDTNLNGAFNMTHPLWSGMRDRKFGRVVTIVDQRPEGPGRPGQLLGFQGRRHRFHQGAGAGGARASITVNVICPGYIGTDMVMAVPEKVRRSIIAQIPVGRLGEPEEIARCVVFLASEDSGFITGATITANGGQYFAG